MPQKQFLPLWEKSPYTTQHRPIVIAGPCSVETREQLFATAKALSEEGIHLFRGGVWKPRTKPGTFSGIGEEGLQLLREVRESFKMQVGTEVATADQVRLAMAYDLDFLWIGTRTTSHPFILEEIATILEGTEKPILVKNPLSPSLDLWVGAVERLYHRGIRRIGLIHRGFDVDRFSKFRNTPLWLLIDQVREQLPNIPIYLDPSHMAGKRSLVPHLAHFAWKRGYEGLMIESHITPEEAWSDPDQQLHPTELGRLLQMLTHEGENGMRLTSYEESLKHLRMQIDEVDEELLRLLSLRTQISKDLGELKRQAHQTPFQAERYEEVLKQWKTNAKLYGVNSHLAEQLYETIHAESLKIQEETDNEQDEGI